ncbi:MAG: alpha/beta hydrolase-fold protein [Bacteroidales bacterium]|jgi:enterochelin esterase-like enzyme|nr:alpha/beta hydrolase-fold protein [Bacteroidales bacterium]
MRRAALLTIFVLFAFGLSFAQGGLRIMESLVMPSRILNQDVKFSVCLPPGYYKGDRSYPVVYLLHGLGDDEASWLEYGRISQFASTATEMGDIVPMIFVMPQGFRTYYVNDYKGSFLYQDMFVKEFVPYIDSMFRTRADSQYRGLMGYSMGGFGALVLHLQYPGIFGSAVPLSISIRTDEQYITEYGPEWDEQWGRLFGAVGIEGPGRITDYYKKNNPFHIIPDIPSSEYNKFRIYIDNGDKEQTLCRSNEELHILMRNLNFPHEFRVREGGHSFSYWCSALPDGLRFISDAFEGKPYRGDAALESNWPVYVDYEVENIVIDNEPVLYYAPSEYHLSSRLYPVLYLAGDFTGTQSFQLIETVNSLVASNEITPMLVVFIPARLLDQYSVIIPILEEKLRIRKGYRFRALAGYQGAAEEVCDIVMKREQFSSCILADGYLNKETVARMLEEMHPDALKKTPFFIYAPDKGDYFEGNGNMHMIMRDRELKHEYRVSEGEGGFEWVVGGWEEMIKFAAINFHR